MPEILAGTRITHGISARTARARSASFSPSTSERREATTLDGWKKRGGYAALEKALGMPPADIVNVVKDSGLRGRGGAGFPTGVKWSFMKPGDGKPHYLCCNADESEPGTFKDREIMRWTPHALIEGCAIGSYAIGAETCYIYIRGEFTEPIARVEAALKECYAAGILGKNAMGTRQDGQRLGASRRGRVHLRRRDRADELARGEARQPAHQAAVPGGVGRVRPADDDQQRRDARRGAAHPQQRRRVVQAVDARRQPEEHGHQALFGVRQHPDARATTKCRWAFRSRISCTISAADRCRAGSSRRSSPAASRFRFRRVDEAEASLMDYEGFVAQGTMLGSGGVIVIDDAQNLVKQIARAARFFAHESCAQCTQCREGTAWTTKILERIVAGDGTPEDLDTLLEIAENMTGKTICVLSDSCATPVVSGIKKFRGDFEALIKKKKARSSSRRWPDG